MTAMAELQPLIGRWATTITMLHPADIRGEVHYALDTYRWLTGGHVIVHEVESRAGSDYMQSVELYAHDDDGNLVSRNYDGGGEISDYAADMSNGVWKIQGETERFVSSTLTDVTIEGVWQLKTPTGWVDWMTVHLDRIGKAAPRDARG